MVLLCVATMAVASASAASDDIVSDDADTSISLSDNTPEPISSTDSDAVAVDSVSDDESLGAIPLDDETSLSATVEDSKEELSEENAVILRDGESSTNTIYVSSTGSDENDGSSQAAAVATLAKAIEIAGASELTDHTIFVANGNYSVAKLESPEGKNINLIGESKEGTIVTASDAYGINVYQDAISWTIENFTFCDYNTNISTSAFLRCFASDSNFVVNNCIFRNIGTKNGPIYITSTGTRRISNCLFENNYGTYSSTSSIIHAYGEGQVILDNIEIKGSYLSPSLGDALYLRALIYADASQTNVVLMNSRIHDNNASLGSIIESKGTFKVINTTIENNYINYSANGINAGTYMFYSGTSSNSASNINITQTVIKDNIIAGGSIGLFNLVYGNHNIDKSVIINNKYANGNDVPIGSVSGSNTKLTADNNYWGTNERPDNRVNQWVILTADVPEYAFVGVAESIPVYLNTYNTTSGETGAVEGMPTVDLGVTYALNQQNPSTVSIANGAGAIDYIATTDGDETVTLSSGDAFSFEVNADVSTLIYVDAAAETSGTGTAESPFKTLAEALNIAADGKIIVVRSGTYTESDLVIDDDITIKADKGATVIIDADEEGRAFIVSSTATLRDLSITGGMALDESSIGGAILVNGGSLTLNNVNISASTAGTGGAIGTTATSNLTVINSGFTENSAMYGGAIYTAGEANISGSKFNGNEVYGNGGAIYVNTTSPVSISSNVFTANEANKGSALYIENGSPVLSGNNMGEEIIYVGGGSLKTILTFIEAKTITAEFGQTLDLTATLTDVDGNTVRGGVVTFTANGETVATVDLSVRDEIKTSYTTPLSADGDVTISGSYSLDNGGSVVDGTIHLAVPYWFIGDTGYETLAQAIAAAEDGDVIIGKPGTYTVNGITINNDITIMANETGTIILDGDKSKMFTLGNLVNVTLLNLELTNGGSSGGGFADVSSSGTLNLINSTLRDLTASSANACIKVASGGNVNIEGCSFENITSTSGSAILAASGSSVVTIKDSSFNNIVQTSADYTLMQITGTLYLERSNFTNVEGKYQSSWYAGVGASSSGNIYATECQFINMTGGDGAAIYFNSGGNINVTKCVFMNTKAYRGAIYVNSPASANINYNLFINNTGDGNNAKALYKNNANANINANYNFWGDNSQPTSSQITNLNGLTYWTIVKLSSDSDIVYVGNTAEIVAQFVATNGEENLTLEDSMPEYSFELTASEGTIAPTAVTLIDNQASATFTPPATEGTVTITATPGPSELVLNVMDPSALLVVSSDGSDETGAGTLDNPYATIAHALSQVTETRNIIYVLNKGQNYEVDEMTVSGNVIIRGENSQVTLDADNGGRIFTVTGTLTLEDIGLTGGMTNGNGGAIYVNEGNLILNNVIITECGGANGGAIATTAGSKLTVTDSVFEDNIGMFGGAIYTEGEAQIEGSKFNGHAYATYGGAIYVNTTSPVGISSNIFIDNDADKGGAVYIENGAVSLSNNTMDEDENIYVGGGTVNSVLIFLGNSTVNGNFGEEITLKATLTDDKGNSIIGGNVVFIADGETIATVSNNGYNIETAYTIPTDATDDILISGSFSLDNGGTVATGVVHPAISYWFIEGGSGYETLAQAIDAASDGDVIYYDKTAPYTEVLNGKTVNKKLVIKNNGTGIVTIDAGKVQMFVVSDDLELNNINFINGSTTQGGFISQSGGTLKIINSSFKDTTATANNGAVLYTSQGNVIIEDSVFDNLDTKIAFYHNSASGSFSISNSVFNNINGTYDGWTIYSKATLSIANSNFTNLVSSRASSSSYYGAIYSSADTKINGSRFVNITGPTGAAVYVTGALNITKSVFDNVTTSYNVIYASGTRNINYNVFLNSGKAVSGSSGNVDYNYFGTNDNPGTDVSGVNLNNWVIMTVTPDTIDNIDAGATQAFTVDFTHYTDGTANYTLADTIPELVVSASAVNGQLDVTEKETVDGQAVFTYTMGDYAADTITFTNANVSIPVTISTVEPYTGIIYVAKDGDDTNDGSEDNPVATIAKAVALAQGKSGQIVINEGTYTESGISISGDLNITTVGDVIWDANGQRAFVMTAGDVSISNITFTNGNQSSAGTLLRVTGGSLTVDGSTFVNNGGNVSGLNGVLNIALADLTLTNCVFENNTASPTGTSYGIVYLSGSTLYVNNCNFTNNRNKYGVFYIAHSTSTTPYTPSIAVINNSAFIGNNASSSSGGQGAAIYVGGTGAYEYSNGTVRPGAHTYVYVENCDFINNTAKYGTSTYGAATSGKGGAIYVNNNATFIAVDSRFINNSALADAINPDGKVGGGAIYASSGEVLMSNCVLDNNQAEVGSEIYMYYYGKDNETLNKLSIANSIINDNGESVIFSDYTNGSLVANSNWWGNNSGPEGKVSEGITVDNWVIMSVDPTMVEDASVGEAVAISVDFKHTNSTDGTIADLEGTLPQEFTVYGYAMNGTFAEDSVVTSDLAASLSFTPAETGENVVVVYTDNSNRVPVVINVPVPVEGVIYVSKDGSDDNPGSESSPVATIAKAVELAKAGTGVIVIKEGTYNENGIVIDSAMSISGEGNVVIDGTGLEEASIFTIATSEAVSIENIKFANNKAANGAAIDIEGTANALLDIDVLVNNCTFDNLQGRNGAGIFAYYTTGNLVVNNSNFTRSNATWGALCAYQSAYGEGLNVEILASNFEDNYANNGPAIYLQASNATIKDSSFVNNKAEYHPGAIYLQNITALIDNCVVANNSAKYDKAAIAIHGGNVQYNPTIVKPSNVTIVNCIIENNTGRDKTAPAIYLENSNLNMSYSSVVNDMNINNTVTATYGDEKPGLVLINNNWWGTNDPSSTIFGTNITMDNWVIMNVVANSTDVDSGEEVKVTVDFNHVNTTAGVIEELTGGVIPKETYTVGFSVDNGTIAPETITIARGESGEAVFTAADANALITVTSESAVENIFVMVGDQPVPYTGIVYVSKDGDDANDGSEDTPVATLAKAIEIATAADGSGQIVIKEGTYTGNGYNITKDLVITGEGDVIIDALSEGNRLFNMGYGCGVSNFELHNLVLKNLNALYGAAVYSYAENVVLDNITITDINSEMSRLITSNGNLTIKDSVFANNTVSGLITQGGTNKNLTIVNTVIEGNNVTYDTSIYGLVYVSGTKGNVVIEDSKFYDNIVRQSTVRGNTEVDITVKKSEFINNTADNLPYYSSGGAIYAQAKLDVSESIFINNQARREGGAICISNTGQATITKSEFINNTVYGDGEYGDAISNRGSATINYCIFLTNGTKYVVYNPGSNAVNGQYNWWGTNDNPQSLVNNVDVSNWIIMNVVADTENVEAGAAIPITVDFKHYIDSNGAVQELADSLAQELTVSFISETGAFDKTEVVTEDHVAQATYTAVLGLNDITVKSSDAIWNIAFNIGKVETSLSVSAEPVTVGETAVIGISLTDIDGNGIDGTVIVTVNGEDKEVTVTGGVGSLELTGLLADTYPISAHFGGTSKYESSDATGTLVVNPKESKLTIVAEPVTVGETAVIGISLTDIDGNGIDGTVIVTVNGENKEVTVSNGVGTLELTGLLADTYPISAHFDGTSEYASSDATGSLVVNPKESKLTIVVDDVVIGESSNITATLTDADGNPVSGTVKVTVGDKEYTINVENGKGSVSTDVIDEIGTVNVVAKFEGDDTMAPIEINDQITAYGPGNVTVKHTDAGDAADIQAAIDAANPGDIVRLGDHDYTDVSDVNITKDVAIVGSEGTTVTSAGDGNPIFNVPLKSENGPDSVNITGIDFKVNNGDVIVKAIAENDTNPLAIDTQAISITNNTIEAANENVVPESVTVLKLESERSVLAPTNDIVISDNTMDAGINPLDFDVTTVNSGSDVTIPVGPISKDRIETQIVYKNMTTTAVDVDTDGRVGKYFYITLTDKNGNKLANKPVQIGFNGNVYSRVTDDKGQAKLQINLKYAGTYTFAVSYLGDDIYNGSFVVAKIVVSKQKGSLTVPNKSYKASVKTKSLTATFKAASGKVVKGKKITFTVNGKTYTATTNAKGVATVKVSLNKKGTYSFTAKFAGNNMYAAISKKGKLVIK